ncbi:MAG: hypothetical protein ACK5RL_20990 [Acidimicrobiales bacterium]
MTHNATQPQGPAQPEPPQTPQAGQDPGAGIGNTLPGLTEDDVLRLERGRSDFINKLMATAAGQDLVRRTDSQIDQIGRGLERDIDGLVAAVGSEDPVRRGSASIVVNDITHHCHRVTNDDLYRHRSPHYKRAQNAHTRMDGWMDRRIRQLRFVEARRKQGLARRWGLLANVFTALAAGALLFFSWFAVAAVLIGLRILLTGLIWSVASYPGDDSPTSPVLDSDPLPCVIGHGGDLLLFASFGMAMVRSHHPATAFLVILAGSIMVLGTLMRLGASASGLPVPRLHLERMVRGGSTFAAIALAAVPTITWWWSAGVMIVLPTVFACIESQEALRALKLHRRRNGPQFELVPVPPGASPAGGPRDGDQSSGRRGGTDGLSGHPAFG